MGPRSKSGPERRLTSDAVQSWCVRLDASPDACARLRATLTGDERSRSARFQFERDRRRFIVARGVLRELLGHYLGAHPASIRFAYNAFGKPELDPGFGGWPKFNLSHSGDLALIAIAGADLGVDLELIRAQPDDAAIAECYFSPAEVDSLNRIPSRLQAQAFYGCWTKKEACVKACGGGLAIPLTRFSVPLTTDAGLTQVDLSGASSEGAAGGHWSLYTLHPAPGYIGALAIEGGGWRLSQRNWTEGIGHLPAPARL
jgi:4'-phosphopantetheinyl transferase